MKREMWYYKKKNLVGFTMQGTFFSFSIVSLFIKNTFTHGRTHNNSRQSISTADYPFCCCAEGQITHVTVADHGFTRRRWRLFWWYGRVKLPQVLSAPPERHTDFRMRLLCARFGGKAQWWHLFKSIFFEEEEKRKQTRNTWVLLFSVVNVNKLCKGTLSQLTLEAS